MDMTFAQTEEARLTSYVDLPYINGSIINPQNHSDKYCAVWSILINLILIKTTASVFRYYVKHFSKINLGEEDFANGIQIKKVSKLEKSIVF